MLTYQQLYEVLEDTKKYYLGLVNKSTTVTMQIPRYIRYSIIAEIFGYKLKNRTGFVEEGKNNSRKVQVGLSLDKLVAIIQKNGARARVGNLGKEAVKRIRGRVASVKAVTVENDIQTLQTRTYIQTGYRVIYELTRT